MSLQELIELVKTLKESGVIHFKNGDMELNFGQQPQQYQPATAVLNHKELKSSSLELPPSIPEKEVPHIIQEMVSLFKSSDEELIDKIFPIVSNNEEMI